MHASTLSCFVAVFVVLVAVSEALVTTWPTVYYISISLYGKKSYFNHGAREDDYLGCWNVDPNSKYIKDQGYYSTGSICFDSYDDPPTKKVFKIDAPYFFTVVKESASGEDSLAKPTDYQLLWTNYNSDAEQYGAIWRPVCPNGYSYLTHYVSNANDWKKPSTNSMRCLRTQLLTSTGIVPSQVWDTEGSKQSDASIWQVTATQMSNPANVWVLIYTKYSAKKSITQEDFYMLDTKHDCPGEPMCNGLGKCDYNTGKCVCNKGYAGSPCVDVDECQFGNPCGQKCLCRNTIGSYTCLPSFSVSTRITNASCYGYNDGQLILDVQGGMAPYKYVYYESTLVVTDTAYEQGLAAGGHLWGVVDSGQCGTANFAYLGQPTPVSLTVTGTNAICAGTVTGTLSGSASGGIGPYTFNVNNGPFAAQTSFSVGAGYHSMSVKDSHFCSPGIAQIYISEPFPITATATVTNVACFGASTGKLVINANGGNGFFQYRLEPNLVVVGDFQSENMFDGLPANRYRITIKDIRGCQTSILATITQPSSSFQAFPVTTPISCYGLQNGQVQIHASGGLPGYSFKKNSGSWVANNVFTGLAVGNYAFYAQDAAGCQLPLASVIYQPDAPLASTASYATVGNASCYGTATGKITLSATGGSLPYTFILNGTQSLVPQTTSLRAGVYSATIKDNYGCTVPSYTVRVYQPANYPNGTIVSINLKCGLVHDGSIAVTPTGGIAPFACSLNNGEFTDCKFSGLAAGRYSVSIRDTHGCAFQLPDVTLTAHPILSVTGTSTRMIECFGYATGQIFATALGGAPPYTYSLAFFENPDISVYNYTSRTISGIVAGNYILTVTDAYNCQAATNVTVSQQSPLVLLTTSSIPPCAGTTGFISASASGGVTPYTFLIGGQKSDTGYYSNLNQGNYSVSVVDSNNCTASRLVTMINIGNDLTGSVSTTPVNCVGRASGSIFINAVGSFAPFTYQLNEGGFYSNPYFSGLPAGRYYATIKDTNGCTFTITDIIVPQLPKLFGTAITYAPTCVGGLDGKMVVHPYGGTAPYSFSFDGTPSVDNYTIAPPGARYAVITDANGCTASVQGLIPQATQIRMSTFSSPPTCAGSSNGEISASASGGLGPYLFTINQVTVPSTFYDMASGDYDLTVTDANGCNISQSVHVPGSNDPLIINATASVIECKGGFSMISYYVFGGTRPYNVSIQPEIGSLSGFSTYGFVLKAPAGNYTLTAEDAYGCASTFNVSIGNAPEIEITFSPVEAVTSFLPNGTGLSDGKFDFSLAGPNFSSFFLANAHQDVDVCVGAEGALNSWESTNGGYVTTAVNHQFLHLAAGNYSFFALSSEFCLYQYPTYLSVYNPTTPDTPSEPSFTIDMLNGFINVSWNAPFDGRNAILQYDIGYYATSDTSGNLPAVFSWSHAKVTAGGATWYKHMFIFGMSYFFRITAINQLGSSSPSIENFITAADAPSAPTGVVCKPKAASETNTGELQISWVPPLSRSNEVLTYEIGMRFDNQSSYSILFSNISGTNYTIRTSLAVGQVHFVRIRSSSNLGFVSSYSPEASAALYAYPTAPQNLTLNITPTNNSACLVASWKAPSFLGSPLSAIVYVTTISSDGGNTFTSLDNSACPNCTSVTVCNTLVYTTSYIFSVSAKNLVIGANSTVTIRYGILPGPAGNVRILSKQVGVSTSTLTVGWDYAASNGPLTVQYSMELSNDNGTSWLAIAKNLYGQQTSIGPYTTGSAFSLRVKSITSMGEVSSSILPVLVAAAPLPPTTAPTLGNVSLTSVSAVLPVSWKKATSTALRGSNVTSYLVNYFNANANTTIGTQVSFNCTNGTLTGLTPGITLVVQYAVCNSIGCGEFSAGSTIALAAIPPAPPAPIVAITSTNVTTQTIRIDFTPNLSAKDGGITSHYEIYYSNSAANETFKQLTSFVPDLSQMPAFSYLYQAPVLKLGVTYNFRIVAVNIAGKSEPSLVSSIRIVHLPARPQIGIIFVSNITTTAVGMNNMTNSTSEDGDSGGAPTSNDANIPVVNALVTWSGDTAAGGYWVEFAQDLEQVWETAGYTTANRFLVKSLQIGFVYNFRITAFVGYENSMPADFGPSSLVFQQNMGVPPYDSVTDLQPKILGYSDNLLTIGWNKAAANGLETTYTLYYLLFDPHVDSTVPALQILASNITANMYSIFNVTDSVYYQFAVSSQNALGSSPVSVTSPLAYIGATPSTPTGVNVTAFSQLENGTVAAELSWNNAGKNLKYLFDYHLSWWNDTEIVTTKYSSFEAECCRGAIDNLPLGANLTIRMLAYDVYSSPYSEEATFPIIVTPGAMRSPSVNHIAISGPNASVSIAWDAVTFTGGDTYIAYKIEHAIVDSEAATDYDWLLVVDDYQGTTYELNDLQRGTYIVFRATAKNHEGYGPASIASYPVYLASAPSAPENLEYEASTTSPIALTLQFDKPSDNGAPILFYSVQYSMVPVRNLTKEPITGTHLVPAGNTTMNTTLPAYNGYAYTVYVFAVNSLGNGAHASHDFVVGLPPHYPPSPVAFGSVAVENHLASFSISWNIDYYDTGVDMYYIQLSKDNFTWADHALINTLLPANTNGSCFNVPYSTVAACEAELILPSGYLYYIRIRAENYFGVAPLGGSASVIAAVLPSFNTTSVVTVETIEKDSTTVADFIVHWPIVSNDGGNLLVLYDLEYTTDPTYVGPYVSLGQTNGTSLWAKDMTLGTPVYFRVTPSAALVGAAAPIGVRFIPAVSPQPVQQVDVTNIGANSMRIEFDIPFNGGVDLFSYTVQVLKEMLNGSAVVYNTTYPIAYVDLLQSGRQSILIPLVRDNFYSFKVLPTNANKLSARKISPYTNSYMAAFYIFRKVLPAFNTLQGNAIISLMGDTIPYSPRLVCKFGSTIFQSINGTCYVPPSNQLGTVSFTFSLDGYLWSNAFDFTYGDKAVISKTSPAAGVVTGGTVVTIAASNLNWTQSVVCYFGPTAVKGTYAHNFATAACRAPFSGRVSPPTVPVSISIDGNPPVLYQQFYYFVNPTLNSVAPATIVGTPGLAITFYGTGFINTGEPIVLKYSSPDYGNFYASASFVSASTIASKMIPLPGFSMSWLVSAAFDGGQTFTNAVPLQVDGSKDACKKLSCDKCNSTKNCNFVKTSTSGWCNTASSHNDPKGPQVSNNCDGYYYEIYVTPIPDKLFNTSNDITYVIDYEVTLHSFKPVVSSPLQVIRCQPSGNWISVSDAVAMIQSVTEKAVFAPFDNYASKPSPRQCAYSLPLSTPLYETQNIGPTIFENDNPDTSLAGMMPFTLRPYGVIMKSVPTEIQFTNTLPYDKAPLLISSIVGTDFLSKVEWFDESLGKSAVQSCGRNQPWCTYALKQDAPPDRDYTVKMVINGIYTDDQTIFNQYKIPFFLQALMIAFGKRSIEPELGSELMIDSVAYGEGEYAQMKHEERLGGVVYNTLTISKKCAPMDDFATNFALYLPKEDKSRFCGNSYVIVGILFPPNQINSVMDIPVYPIDGQYGSKFNGYMDVYFYQAGNILVKGNMHFFLYSKKKGEINIDVSCNFITANHEHQLDICDVSIVGEFTYPIPFSTSGVDGQIDLIPKINLQLHLQLKSVVGNKGWAVGSDLTLYGSGWIALQIKASATLGCSFAGVTVKADITGTMPIQILTGKPFITGLYIKGSVYAEACLLLCAGGSIDFAVDLPFEIGKRSMDNVMDQQSRWDRLQNKQYRIESGAWGSHFLHHNARATAGSGSINKLISDVYPGNHMRLFDLARNINTPIALALSTGYHNTSNLPGSAHSIMYSIYDYATATFGAPAPIYDSLGSEGSPFAVLYNSSTYMMMFVRTKPWSGNNVNDVGQILEWGKSTNIYYSFYDAVNDKWSAEAAVTSGDHTLYFGITAVMFGSNVMTIFNSDFDGDMSTKNDSNYAYSIFSSGSWSTPKKLFNATSLGETSIASNNQYVLYGFYGVGPTDDVEAQFAVYDINAGTWAQPQPLFDLDIAEDFTADPNATIPETIETDIQITVHQGRFILSWIRNRVVLFRVWTDSSTTSAARLSDLESSSNFARTFTVGAGTSTDPQYTVMVYQETIGGATPIVRLATSLMEPGSFTFGGASYISLDSTTSVTYQDITLLPSQNPNSALPTLLNVFTDRVKITDPVTNATSFGEASLKYTVLDLTPSVAVTSLDIEQIDDVTLKITVAVENKGVVSTIAYRTAMKVFTGSDSMPLVSLNEYSLPFMVSTGTLTYSFLWTPDSSFQGYLWANFFNMDSDDTSNEIKFPVFVPSFQGAKFTGRPGGENGTSLIDVTAELLNTISIDYANATIPVALYTINSQTSKQVLIASTEVVVSPTANGEIKFTINETQILGNLVLVAGIEATDAPFTAPFGVTFVSSSMTMPITLDLQLSDASRMTVVNQLASSGVVQLSIQNVAVFSTPALINIYSSHAQEIDMRSFATATDVPNMELISTSANFMATSLTASNVLVNCPTTVGLKSYCFEVVTSAAELSKRNNFFCANITFRTSAQLSYSTEDIIIDQETGNMTVIVYNYGTEGVENAALLVYQYSTSDTPVYLGTSTPFNINKSSVQFTSLTGLAETFANANPDTFALQIVLSGDFTSDGADSSLVVALTDVESNTLPPYPAGTTLFEALKILVADWSVDLTQQTSHSPLVVKGFNILHANTFKLNITKLPSVINFETNNYADTGLAYLSYQSNEFFHLDPVLAKNTYKIEVDLVLLDDSSILDSFTFNFTVTACPQGMFTCKDFTCVAQESLCGRAGRRCPVSSPILVNHNCYTQEAFALLSPTSFNATIPLHTTSVFVVGDFTFKIPANVIETTDNKTELFISPDADVDISLALPPVSGVFTVRLAESPASNDSFNTALEIEIPNWNSSLTSDDLDSYCLASLNSVSNMWTCVPSSSLAFGSSLKRGVGSVVVQSPSPGVLGVINKVQSGKASTTTTTTTTTTTITTSTTSTTTTSTTATTSTSTSAAATSTTAATTSTSDSTSKTSTSKAPSTTTTSSDAATTTSTSSGKESTTSASTAGLTSLSTATSTSSTSAASVITSTSSSSVAPATTSTTSSSAAPATTSTSSTSAAPAPTSTSSTIATPASTSTSSSSYVPDTTSTSSTIAAPTTTSTSSSSAAQSTTSTITVPATTSTSSSSSELSTTSTSATVAVPATTSASSTSTDIGTSSASGTTSSSSNDISTTSSKGTSTTSSASTVGISTSSNSATTESPSSTSSTSSKPSTSTTVGTTTTSGNSKSTTSSAEGTTSSTTTSTTQVASTTTATIGTTTNSPTETPTLPPTQKPTNTPTSDPTYAPTQNPTAEPTNEPTAIPTEAPTTLPTEAPTPPTETPTTLPTEAPTPPTETPTTLPTEAPTTSPTDPPTNKPTLAPTTTPTTTPTNNQTNNTIVQIVTQVVVKQKMSGDFETFNTTKYCEVVKSGLGDNVLDVKCAKELLTKRSQDFAVSTTIVIPQKQSTNTTSGGVSDADIQSSITAQLSSSAVSEFLASTGTSAEPPTFTIQHDVEIVVPAPTTAPTKAPTSAPTASPTTTGEPVENHHGGVNKVGVGLGVPFAVLFVIAVAVIAYLKRHTIKHALRGNNHKMIELSVIMPEGEFTNYNTM